MRTPFDVLVNDIQMDKMSGLELVVAMKATGLDLPVVLITGRPDVETAIKAVAWRASR